VAQDLVCGGLAFFCDQIPMSLQALSDTLQPMQAVGAIRLRGLVLFWSCSLMPACSTSDANKDDLLTQRADDQAESQDDRERDEETDDADREGNDSDGQADDSDDGNGSDNDSDREADDSDSAGVDDLDDEGYQDASLGCDFHAVVLEFVERDAVDCSEFMRELPDGGGVSGEFAECFEKAQGLKRDAFSIVVMNGIDSLYGYAWVVKSSGDMLSFHYDSHPGGGGTGAETISVSACEPFMGELHCIRLGDDESICDYGQRVK
jgi:hypothetical protein